MRTRAKKVLKNEDKKPLKVPIAKVSKNSKKKSEKDVNETVLPSCPNNIDISQSTEIGKLDQLFLVKHPEELLTCWSWAKILDPNSPRDAFKEVCGLTLVGPFQYLDNCLEDAENAVNTARTATDLPEMQTILTYDQGRFCYWRDIPNDCQPYLVHVSNQPEHFPDIELIGDSNPLCALYHLINIKNMRVDDHKHLLPDPNSMEHYGAEFVKQLKKKRAKEAIGKPFHAMGIKVEVKQDVGYRPVTHNYKKLQQDLETMGTTSDEHTKAALRTSILEIFSNVQFANDELDFGMGLEFGHQLFLSNYSCFDGISKSVLRTAYSLLNRPQFTQILEAQYVKRRKSIN